MLGRLLHLGGAGGPSAPLQQQTATAHHVSSLDSVQEDIHTRNLLFPDPETLPQNRGDQVLPLSSIPLSHPFSATTAAFDANDDVDLETQDVRVLVMQDALGHTNASLLFDSHPPPTPPPAAPSSDRPHAAPSDSRRTPPISNRKPSIGQASRHSAIYPESPLPRQGAFDRRGSLHGRTQSFKETDTQRAAREYRDELATFSSCVFGNSELMAYKGTSTKVHVVPSESRIADHPASLIGDGRSSIGRSSSKLSQSFTSQTFSPSTFSTNAPSSRYAAKKKVLITRLFPVNVNNDGWASDPTHQSNFSDDNTGYPFPAGAEEQTSRTKSPPMQRRTPMYAVVLVVHLPAPRLSAGMTPRSAFRESSSYSDQDVFSSSYGSARPPWWNAAGSGAFGEASESSFSADIEDRIDSLTQHWDIIMRTLTRLQSVAATTIGSMLKQADETSDALASAIPHSMATARGQMPPERRRSADIPRPKPSKGTVRLVSLQPNCLSSDTRIAAEATMARKRVVVGVRAARVVTGQGRWGIWRDEAIWASRWSRSLESGPFLQNLLTGFLAAHTEWLQALAPPSLRRRYFGSRQQRDGEDLALPARTVIVSEDKMVARRLIFLLSAFMPANQQLTASRPHRPSTSASATGLAHSPPSYVVPILREESLRRKINRRTGSRRMSHSRNTSQGARTSAVPAQLAHLGMERSHDRRVSDAGSIRPSNLAMPGNDWSSRKSSAATTATVLPEATMPHFSSAQRTGGPSALRPDSSGSLATDDLRRSLQRGESSHASTPSADSRSQSSKWGSVISGLWTPRRRDSTSLTSPTQASDTKSPISRPPPARRDKLAEMVREASAMDQASPDAVTGGGEMGPRDVVGSGDQFGRPPRPSLSHVDRPIDPTALESPVKTSVNEDDGVIDVDFPFPEYITSFESAISSPSSSGYLPTPGTGLGGLESFENSARASVDGDPPINVAGWLTRFHPDFALQAVPPQDDIVDQVKATLRAEPTPSYVATRSPQDGFAQHWVEMGSVIIADTSTYSVRRIVHRRLVLPRRPVDMPGSGNTSASFPATAPHTPSVLPYEDHLGEEFIEEPVTRADDILVEALDRIMGTTSDGSRDSPLARSMSRAGSESENVLSERAREASHSQTNTAEAPRTQCRAVILSALEDVIRDSIDRPDAKVEHGLTGCGGSILHDAVQGWISKIDTVA